MRTKTRKGRRTRRTILPHSPGTGDKVREAEIDHGVDDNERDDEIDVYDRVRSLQKDIVHCLGDMASLQRSGGHLDCEAR